MKESIEHLSNPTFIRCHSKYLGVFTIHMHLKNFMEGKKKEEEEEKKKVTSRSNEFHS